MARMPERTRRCQRRKERRDGNGGIKRRSSGGIVLNAVSMGWLRGSRAESCAMNTCVPKSYLPRPFIPSSVPRI